MGQAKRKSLDKPMAVYQVMAQQDAFDLTLISVIAAMLQTLKERNGDNPYRMSRLNTMEELLLEKVEPSYKGYLPDAFINCSSKFIKMMYTDLNSLLKNLKGVK